MPDPVPERENIGEANLAFFMRDRFEEVLKHVKPVEKLSSAEWDFVGGELLESFLWLHHGVQVEYFPLGITRRVIYEFFPLFLKAHESVRSGRHYETWFTQPLRAIFESEFSGNWALFSSPGKIWPSRESLAPPVTLVPSGTDALFQSLLVLANGLTQNSDARLLLQAVTTADESGWKKTLSDKRPPSELEESFPNDEDSHWTSPGFFVVLQYMQAFRIMKLDLQDHYPDENQQDFIRLLKETQQWRLNFGYPDFRDRFIQIARMAAETYVQQLEGAASTALAGFLKEFRELMTDWGAPLTKGAGA